MNIPFVSTWTLPPGRTSKFFFVPLFAIQWACVKYSNVWVPASEDVNESFPVKWLERGKVSCQTSLYHFSFESWTSVLLDTTYLGVHSYVHPHKTHFLCTVRSCRISGQGYLGLKLMRSSSKRSRHSDMTSLSITHTAVDIFLNAVLVSIQVRDVRCRYDYNISNWLK